MYTTLKTAKIITLYLIALYLTSALLCSCSTVRRDEGRGCYSQRHYIGYGAGGYAKATKISKRRNY